MKFLIVDDHAAMRRGIQQILEEEFPEAEICGAADSSAVIEFLQTSRWDLILCDITLPGRNGLEVLKEIKFAQPIVPVLMLSNHPEEQFALRALKAGASGYITKSSEPEEIVEAVHAVMAGRKYVGQRLAEQLAASIGMPVDKQPHELLSNREFEVFLLLAAGKEVKEVGADLDLSVKTISTHREHILRKMQLRNNAAMTVYAVRNNLVG